MNKRVNILVVDDDQEIGFMFKLMLEHKGFLVTVTQRAEQLEYIIIRHSINLIILDMLIAGVKGTDVCARLKGNEATASIPIIMVTALPDCEKICIEAGANGFLAKPFEMAELISKINLLIGSTAIASNNSNPGHVSI